MKKLSVKLWLMLGLMIPIIYACDEDDDGIDLLFPTVDAPADVVTAVGETVPVSYQVNTPGGFEEVQLAVDPPTLGTISNVVQPNPGDEEGTVSFDFTAAEEGTGEIQLDVEDQQGQESSGASNNIAVTVNPAGTPTDSLAVIPEIIQSNDSLTSLYAALDAAGLVEALEGDGPFTVFAPSDEAFDAVVGALEFDDIDDLVTGLLGGDTLSMLLQAHVVEGALTADQLMTQDYPTLNPNETLSVVVDGGTITVDGATVVTPNIEAGNGIIHVIDSVVNTGAEGDNGGMDTTIATTVVDTVVNRDDLSSLETAVITAGLVDALSGEGPFTIFAPNDDAFTALIESLDDVEDLDDIVEAVGQEGLATLLQAHVVADSLPSDMLMAQDYPTLAEGTNITVVTEGGVTVNGAAVVETNLLAENGVVHIIDAVINLPEELATEEDEEEDEDMALGNTVADTDELDSLEVALGLADLIDALNDEGQELTVFAPDNEAFQAALTANNVETVEDLVNALETAEMGSASALLLGHVVAGTFTTEDLSDGQELATINNPARTLTVGITESGVTINDVPVSETDIEATNGVIHIIDGVIPNP